MALAGSLAFGGYGRMGVVGEMNGVASQANGLYAAYLESLFSRAGMLSESLKRKEPLLGQFDAARDFNPVVYTGHYLFDYFLHRYSRNLAGNRSHPFGKFRAKDTGVSSTGLCGSVLRQNRGVHVLYRCIYSYCWRYSDRPVRMMRIGKLRRT